MQDELVARTYTRTPTTVLITFLYCIVLVQERNALAAQREAALVATRLVRGVFDMYFYICWWD